MMIMFVFAVIESFLLIIILHFMVVKVIIVSILTSVHGFHFSKEFDFVMSYT